MQKAHLRLLEVIYEITDQCYQDCSYCGSKESLNKTPIDSEKIRKIIDNIASFPPTEIDISGGNPLLVSFDDHKYLVTTLQSRNVKCKILFNPFNVQSVSHLKIIDLYDWSGISINTKQELNEIKNWKSINNNSTIITNFNTNNIFLFNEIDSFCKEKNFQWQIQYTMYKGDDERAIYQNKEAVNYFNSLVSKAKSQIIRADNCNNGKCSAGLYSMGILANGDVIPCLSMRSWSYDLLIKGNLLNESLFGIWAEGFAIFRCNDFICCKDICQLKKEPVSEDISLDLVKELEKPKYDPNMTFLYGVKTNPIVGPIEYPNVMAYAVQMPTTTCLYAVQSNYGKVESSITTNNTNNTTDWIKNGKF